MIENFSLEDLSLLRESVTLECKLAIGVDGKGVLPDDFWPTYSAMANTDGGLVILGMRERKGRFEVQGLENIDKVRKDLFNQLNNHNKTNINLLTDRHVFEHEIDNKKLLIINIPRAQRKQQPVYITSNPFGNTYRRFNEGDKRLLNDEVKRMLAEQVEDSLDHRIMLGYDFEDLDMETFRTYRQVFINRNPLHPWNEETDNGFLRQIGGWRRDRETGKEGLTQAGLLMFGRMSAIQEALPNYMLDYQERPEIKTEKRWVDRLTLDGNWSGNLYDFYRKVYLKLIADLKIPFQLSKDERQDETPVHIALREALANVLVHADYSDRASILVVKQPDMFGFRNPGLMRIPVEVALQGGEADCRNRNLHKMFRFVGVGEQAGTGIPRILQGWSSQHWSPPKLHESTEPYNQTILELRMIDLFPSQVMDTLRVRFGDDFEGLSEDERVALALAASEGTVNHARLCSVSSSHPVDLTRMLRALTKLGLLSSKGSGSGTVYFLAGDELPTPDDVFGTVTNISNIRSSHLTSSSSHLTSSSSHLTSSSSHLGGSSLDLNPLNLEVEKSRDEHGYLHSEQLALPVIDDLQTLSPVLKQKLNALAVVPQRKKKMDKKEFEKTVLAVCEGHFLTLQVLAQLLNRNPSSLRNNYLSPMVREKTLTLAFPTTPTHEKQAYCSTSSLVEIETK